MLLQKWKDNSLLYDLWYDLQLCRVQKLFCPFVQEPQIIWSQLNKTSLLCWLKNKSALIWGVNIHYQRLLEFNTTENTENAHQLRFHTKQKMAFPHQTPIAKLPPNIPRFFPVYLGSPKESNSVDGQICLQQMSLSSFRQHWFQDLPNIQSSDNTTIS